MLKLYADKSIVYSQWKWHQQSI